MKDLKSAFSLLVGLSLLAGTAYAATLIVMAILEALRNADSGITVATIAASATIIVSVISVIVQKHFESRAAIQKEHREKKIPVYESLMKFVFRILVGTKTGNTPSEAEALDFASSFTPQIMVWGSDGVLVAWAKFRHLAANKKALADNPIELMFGYEEIVLAIRKDLGHKNKGIKKGDILKLFINDIDQYLPAKPSGS